MTTYTMKCAYCGKKFNTTWGNINSVCPTCKSKIRRTFKK